MVICYFMAHTNPREAKTLLAINGIFGFAISLGGIFLQVFLFTLGGFEAVAQFNLISACAIVVFFIISGWALARVTSKHLLLFGIVSYILFFLLLLIFREQSLSLLPVLGVINGMATGLFWGGLNLLHYLYTTDKTRNRFFGAQNSLFSITGGIAPIIGGMIITLVGSLMSKEFGYSFVFFLIALLMTILYREATKLPEHETIDFSFAHIVSHRRSRIWKLTLLHDVCYGVFDIMFPAFSAVIIFLIVKGEFLLGVVNGTGALVAACAGLGASRVLAKRKTSFGILALIAAVGMGLFAWQQNWWGLAALIFLLSAAMPILHVASSTIVFGILDRLGNRWQEKYHLLLEREIALGAGRIGSLLIFLLAVNDRNQLEIARSAMGFLALIPLCIGFLLSRMARKHI